MFIGNIVKCRPPENRDPLPEEWDACLPWLREQFKLIRPKIVVCLGRIAAQRLIRPDFSVTKEHGQFEEKNGVLFTATPCTRRPAAQPHPKKPLAFADYVAPAGKDPRGVRSHLLKPFIPAKGRAFQRTALVISALLPGCKPFHRARPGKVFSSHARTPEGSNLHAPAGQAVRHTMQFTHLSPSTR